MLTIEEYLDRAKYIGRIQGAAETIEDEATRDGLYGDAEYLFGYLVEDATNDDNERNNALHRLQEEVSKPVPGPTTNFARITQSPEELAGILCDVVCPVGKDRCPEDEDCISCTVKWLNEVAYD